MAVQKAGYSRKDGSLIRPSNPAEANRILDLIMLQTNGLVSPDVAVKAVHDAGWGCTNSTVAARRRFYLRRRHSAERTEAAGLVEPEAAVDVGAPTVVHPLLPAVGSLPSTYLAECLREIDRRLQGMEQLQAVIREMASKK